MALTFSLILLTTIIHLHPYIATAVTVHLLLKLFYLSRFLHLLRTFFVVLRHRSRFRLWPFCFPRWFIPWCTGAGSGRKLVCCVKPCPVRSQQPRRSIIITNSVNPMKSTTPTILVSISSSSAEGIAIPPHPLPFPQSSSPSYPDLEENVILILTFLEI
ncbi:hypothetical protein RJT34_21913 [Clitoria ternatea]|uniref:Uncharacterized protein n=1 Tax=Clitoria ternatea TaxID=43366 RepID=A0AAN9P6V4_CLITE